jgi:hypothetical protein
MKIEHCLRLLIALVVTLGAFAPRVGWAESKAGIKAPTAAGPTQNQHAAATPRFIPSASKPNTVVAIPGNTAGRRATQVNTVLGGPATVKIRVRSSAPH